MYTAIQPKIIVPRLSGYAATAKPPCRSPFTADHNAEEETEEETGDDQKYDAAIDSASMPAFPEVQILAPLESVGFRSMRSVAFQ